MDESVDLGLPDLKDKITSLRNTVRSLELRLSGHIWDARATSFVYTGDVLAGTTIINKAVGLLQPFCEESNLLTSKQRVGIERQIHNVCKAFNNTLMDDVGCIKENYNVIWSMFLNTLDNICDIIEDSKSVMSSMFKKPEEEPQPAVL